MNDLSSVHPDKVEALKAKWQAAAVAHNVLPLDDRPLLLKMVQARAGKLRKVWDIRPPIDPLPTDISPIVCGMSHSLEVSLDRPRGDEDGVLIAHGSMPAGYVLYVDKGHLVYETSLTPYGERIVSSVALPKGKVKVKYKQSMTSRPFAGSGALFINGRKVADHVFERALFAPGYDGFCIGADLGNRVSKAYEGPNTFKGHIERVLINVDTAPLNPVETLRFMNEMQIRV